MKTSPESKNASSSFLKTDGGETKSNAMEVPSISLPKGGGAIKGIDEKFQVNAANGTASFSLPFLASPNRNGFTPQLALSYNSGVGNSLFGLGWDIDLPAIQRRTDKKLPRYFDSNDPADAQNEDSFMFSGAEELVPYLNEENGDWIIRQHESNGCIIRQYRPRIEGGFSRIERIYHSDHGYYWRVTSKDNITTFFGYSASCRIADPKHPSKVFQWLPEFAFDDKGSWVWYAYKAEDLEGVQNDVFEKNRFNENAPFVNRHLKRIRYGNEVAYYLQDNQNPYLFNRPQNTPEEPKNEHFCFELVLDYGEHDMNNPTPDDTDPWSSRQDPFSAYRSGFEMRTYRLCKRVLMFHTFTELNNGMATLVRSVDFDHQPSDQQIAESDRPTEFTYLTGITQKGYVWRNIGYASKALPSLTFDYQWLRWETTVKDVTAENLVHAPVGLSGNYQWTDLYNEGINGILTEQANAWFYKSNLGPNAEGNVQFSHAQVVMPKPSFMGLTNGVLQLQDLDGNGEKQLVVTSPGMQGYFEWTDDGDWQPFKAFLKTLHLDLRDPNVRMLDVNGDGKPEVVLSDLGAFWYWENEGKTGYDSPEWVVKPYDEELGAAIVFSDQEQRIFLADLSGDGLTDIVRIRNGEVCYWPNVGYGRFGAKVTMGNAPVFDHPDLFNPAYLQLADISGTGATDLIYLGKNKFKAYLNFSGNAWSDATEIEPFFPTEQPNKITVTDLLGNGTACIVWSSEIPAYSHAPMRFIDLMGGKKPHIMRNHKNGLGKTTEVEYKSSTWFYLQDKRNGKPWITKLPFPVQVVAKTVVTEAVTNMRFAAEYTYHHGYYDHAEREFRGFGQVDQTDTEFFEVFEQTGAGNVVPREHHQTPVLTKTWFHTGAFLAQDRILKQYEAEYWYHAADSPHLNDDVLDDAFIDFSPEINALRAEEWREAIRACKGMTLRQEVFALDQSDQESIPYSVATHTCHIRPLQPRLGQRNAVFLVLESEALHFSYERIPEDARVAHSMNLEIDRFGQVTKAVSIVYGRKEGQYSVLPDFNFDNDFQAAHQEVIDAEQRKTHVILSENQFTNDLTTNTAFYRLPLPCAVKTYECQGLQFNTPDGFFTKTEIRNALDGIAELPYQAAGTTTGKRLIEHIQTRYRRNNLVEALPLGQLESLALPWEAYQLAFTPALLAELYGDKLPETDWENTLETNGKYEKMDGENYWISSGKPLFDTNAAAGFYAPSGYEDPFLTTTHVEYDAYHLSIRRAISARDTPLETVTEVTTFDYRTLSPVRMTDINGNFSAVVTDELGMVVATAAYGKDGQGDTLDGGDWLFTPERINAFFDNPHEEATGLLGHATSCLIYDLDRDDEQPTRVATITRETHFRTLENGVLIENPTTRYQIGIEYSDGLGNVALKKVQAEPEAGSTTLRWIGNGRTVLNNKGKPIKQYEPYFSPTQHYETETEAVRNQGVTPVLYYDSVGRNIRTEMPDGTFTKVEFDAWEQRSFDQNDTVLESLWRVNPDNAAAFSQSEIHADTPSIIYLDSLGRPFYSIAHNRWNKPMGNSTELTEAFYPTYVELDIEGNSHKVVDARNNSVMEYKYDMLGHLLYQLGMDNGERWMLNDCMGKPLMAWDENGIETLDGTVNNRELRLLTTEYDILHRPTHTFLSVNGNEPPFLIDQIEYGENAPNAETHNLKGQAIRRRDGSGQMTNVRYDFKGNLLESQKQMPADTQAEIVDWQTATLDAETFILRTEYDALNRMRRLYNWHRNVGDAAVYEPTYSERGVLLSESLTVQGNRTTVVSDIRYDAKGQRTRLRYGNGTTTCYHYDPNTFRLLQLRTTRHGAGPCERLAKSNLTDANVLQNLFYTYDPVGNMLEIEDDAYEPVFFRNQMVEPRSRYEYDALYRLIRASGRENYQATTAPKGFGQGEEMPGMDFGNDGQALRNYTQQYEYDAAGNFILMQHLANGGSWTRHYETDPHSNRLLRTWLGTDEANAVRYRYDLHGSMLNFANVPEEQHTRWDYRDMIHSMDLEGGGMAYYQYGNDKQRSRKTIVRSGGIREERLYLGGTERYRRWQGDALVEEIETLHVFEGEQRILLVENVISTDNNQLDARLLYRYQYSNHLGSTAVELDEDGEIISYEEYHPYGTTAFQAKNGAIRCVAKRYRFTGMERDEESGLAYHTARYYLPWLGRWGSCDPIGVEGGGNLYDYCLGNAISHKDENGRDSTVVDRNLQEGGRRVVERRVHMGYLMHIGNNTEGLAEDSAEARPVTQEEISEARDVLQERLDQKFQDFEVRENGVLYRYIFDIEVQVAEGDSAPPVQGLILGDEYNIPALLQEANDRGLENIIIYSQTSRRPGADADAPVNPGTRFRERAEGLGIMRHTLAPDSNGRAFPLLTQASNIIQIGRQDFVSSGPHEAGHTLGLAHNHSSGIMDAPDTPEDLQQIQDIGIEEWRARRPMTTREHGYIHQAVQMGMPGIAVIRDSREARRDPRRSAQLLWAGRFQSFRQQFHGANEYLNRVGQ